MKISSVVIIALAVGICGLRAQTPVGATSQTSLPPPGDYQVVQQDGNSRVWQRERYEQGPDGQILTNLDKYTEIAIGLNHLVGKQWVPSDEAIGIMPDGTGAATNGQHQVFFPSDILSGEIELITQDGKHIKSQPSALCYDDRSNTVLIAVLTNSIGQIINTNQVIYTNAFIGVNADLLYTYTKAGFEQDVILREQPPAPAEFNMDPDKTRLEVLTEFFNPPQPQVISGTLPEQAGMALDDETLIFGTMQMVPGRSFILGEDSPSVQVGKQWVTLDSRQFLVEAVPVAAMADELESLPAPLTQGGTARNVSGKWALPPRHLARENGQSMKLAAVDLKRKPGVLMDYMTINGSLSGYTFRGDMTYYLSGNVNLSGTNTFEGGTILKYASGTSLNFSSSLVKWLTSTYLPVIFTAKDDNTAGDTISGSTGSPSGFYGNPALSFSSFANQTLSNYRVEYAKQAISATASTFTNVNCQFVNCQNTLTFNSTTISQTVNFRNALFSHIVTNVIENAAFCGVNIQNGTFSDISYLFADTGTKFTMAMTNCIFANITNIYAGTPPITYLYGSDNGFYDSPTLGVNQLTNSFYPFQTVGAGSYYLTNGCAFHNVGTTNIDPGLAVDLVGETTYPPLVYSNAIISANLTLFPQAQRDNTGSPDLGYHYAPLDYVFGGSDLYSNLSLTAGTAVGWFEHGGALNFASQPYALSLNGGSSLTASGTATAPCWIAQYDGVQENVNGNWVGSGYMGAFMLNGSGSGATPSINTVFTKWTVPWSSLLIRDSGYPGEGTFANTEFYGGSFGTYDTTFLYFSNCLFFRPAFYFYDSTAALNLTMQNCTFYNRFMALGRSSGQNSSFWNIENTSFDGTGFSMNDNYNGNSSYTLFNYNAYNTNNLSGLSFSYPYTPAPTNFLEVIGPKDVMVTNYQWQSSWFGNFYLPPNSPLIGAGSTNANLLGLYHFTTQTNQAVEGNAIVDIGYHYVATDTNGIPLDTNGDGIPDYLEDANGNGLVDSGEIGWNLTNDLGLQVIISQPRNGSSIP